MITRLTIDGFKNLVDIDLRFGPFTCIAGENGVGKSNIFDAIQFMSFLADYPLIEAISLIRNKDKKFLKYSQLRDIFRRSGEFLSTTLEISVEMIIPKTGNDDLGQEAEATFNFLKYTIGLELDKEDEVQPVKITKEELVPLAKSKAGNYLLFPHKSKWRNNILRGKRNVPYISTTIENSESYVNLHQDGGSSGKPRPFKSDALPRTVLSTARYASETPTVLLARREMQSWKFLQLEPSALRQPNELEKFNINVQIDSDGANMPAVVYKLSKSQVILDNYGDADGLYSELAYKLSDLIENITEVRVDKDEKRQLLTLEVKVKDGTVYPARSLSDGTLRFLALSIIDLDPGERSLICLEEPENGIHPERINSMISLLMSIPVDVGDEDIANNPLRQIIVNTHSPSVVAEIPDASLIYIQTKKIVKDDQIIEVAAAKALPDTWRVDKAKEESMKNGRLLSYLSPISHHTAPNGRNRKVKHREDIKNIMQLALFNGN